MIINPIVIPFYRREQKMKKVTKLQSGTIKLLLIGLFVFFSTAAYAEDLSFSWSANPEPVTGYKLYYKTGTNSSPPYNGTGLKESASPIDMGKVTNFTVTGRNVNETYHFALTAYNDQGESDYTTVVTVNPLDMTAPVINVIRLN